MQDHLVLQALLVLIHLEKEDHPGHRVLQAFQVLLVQVDRQGHKEIQGVLDHLELLEVQVLLELPAHLVQQEPWVLLVLRETQETQGV